MSPLKIICLAFIFASLALMLKHTHTKLLNLTGEKTSSLPVSAHKLPIKHTAGLTQTEANKQLSWINIIVKNNDTLGELLENHGVNASTLHEIIDESEAKQYLNYIQPGETIQIQLNDKKELLQMKYHFSFTKYLLVTKAKHDYITSIKTIPLENRIFYATGTIHHSLAKAMQNANLNHDMLPKFTHIFSWKVNFKKSLRPGDHFSILYLQYFLNGEKIKDGDILAAELDNKKTAYQAIRYQGVYTPIGYFTPEGKNLTARFLRYPVKKLHVSSRFSIGRLHPVLGIIRPHWGVDFAAPTGTPIYATADGTISRIRNEKGYGNIIFIRHNTEYSSRYAHLLKFAKGLKRYSQVKKGQIIGYVGSTGVSTGPHVHYEIRRYGIPKNPLTINLPAGKPVAKKDMPEFNRVTQALLNELKLHRQTKQAQKTVLSPTKQG